MTWEELLEKVPEEMRPIVQEYGPIVMQSLEECFGDFVDAIMAHREMDAYEIAFRVMTKEQQMTAMIQTNEEMKEAKGRALSMDSIIKEIGQRIIRAGWAMFRVWLGSKGLPTS